MFIRYALDAASDWIRIGACNKIVQRTLRVLQSPKFRRMPIQTNVSEVGGHARAAIKLVYKPDNLSVSRHSLLISGHIIDLLTKREIGPRHCACRLSPR